SYSFKDPANAEHKIFDYQLWEPGYIQYDKFELINNGNLHFKYQLSIMSNETLTELADVIDVYYIEKAPASVTRESFTDTNKLGTLSSILANGGLLIKGDTNDFEDAINDGTADTIFTSYIALKMQESAGNTYQNMPLYKDETDGTAGFSVKLEATQYTYEEDSFDKNYDEKAELPVLVSSAAELAEALTAGETNLTLSAGTYTLPNAIKNKTVTLSGTKDTVIDVTGGLTYINGASVTFDGLTIKSKPGTGYNYGFADAKDSVFNNCTIEGSLGLDYSSEFNNCVFNISGNNYNIWTWGAGTATFNGCTFNCDGKAMLVYANVLDNGTTHQTVNITDCVFNDNGDDTVTGKAAIEITNTYTPIRTYDVIINNTTVNGFAQTVPGVGDFNATYGSVAGSDIGTNVWGNKCELPNTQINVVIDGVDVY
ncbi:MAG: hypothetical protein IJ391_03865, partial [Clostridia bacterium]|nr:hypothetical protein [Clostridia bacterium]